MSDRECFLARIQAEPNYLLHRLIYADWLADHGLHEEERKARQEAHLRAIAIDPFAMGPRLEYANWLEENDTGPKVMKYNPELAIKQLDPRVNVGGNGFGDMAIEIRKFCEGKRDDLPVLTVYEMLQLNDELDFSRFHMSEIERSITARNISIGLESTRIVCGPLIEIVKFKNPNRGAVTFSPEWIIRWIDKNSQLFRENPIQRIEIEGLRLWPLSEVPVGREQDCQTDDYCWENLPNELVPRWVDLRVEGLTCLLEHYRYDSPEAAIEDLSYSFVNRGRRLVGLPELVAPLDQVRDPHVCVAREHRTN